MSGIKRNGFAGKYIRISGLIFVVFMLLFLSGCTPKVDLDSPRQIVASFVYYFLSGDFMTAEQYCTTEFNNRELKIAKKALKEMPARMAAELARDIPHNHRELKQYRREAEIRFMISQEGDKCKVWDPDEKFFSFGLVQEYGQWKVYRWHGVSEALDKLPPGASMDFLDFSRAFR